MNMEIKRELPSDGEIDVVEHKIQVNTNVSNKNNSQFYSSHAIKYFNILHGHFFVLYL